MASKLFDYDNPFFMFMSRIWDLMILELPCRFTLSSGHNSRGVGDGIVLYNS